MTVRSLTLPGLYRTALYSVHYVHNDVRNKSLDFRRLQTHFNDRERGITEYSQQFQGFVYSLSIAHCVRETPKRCHSMKIKTKAPPSTPGNHLRLTTDTTFRPITKRHPCRMPFLSVRSEWTKVQLFQTDIPVHYGTDDCSNLVPRVVIRAHCYPLSKCKVLKGHTTYRKRPYSLS